MKKRTNRLREQDRYRWYGGGSVLLGGAAPNPQITVQDIDGVPSFTNVNILQFDQADGFTISEPLAGVARVDFSGAGGLGDPGANGVVVRTALNTTTARTLTGTANRIVITNGTGVAGNPTFDIGTDVVVINARNVITPPVITSGITPYLRIVTPADTGMTASTESIGIVLGGTNASPPLTVARQYATGALALHREVYIPPVTIGFVAASTLTDAVSLEVGAPVQGTNATITRRAHFGWNGADGSAIAIHGRNVDLGSNVVISTHDSGGQVRLVLMRDRVNFFESEGQISNTFGSGTLSFGSGNVTQRVLIDAAGLVGINKASSIGAQQHTVANAAGVIGMIVDSAASPTADFARFRHNASDTAAFRIKPEGYYTYPGCNILTANFDAVATTTYATVTGCSFNVKAGAKYIVLVQANLTVSAAGGGKFRFSGTATMTGFGIQGLTFDNTANSVIGAVGVTFGGDYTEGLTGAVTAGLSVTFRGSMQVNAAGTFTLQFAQQVASGTSTVNAFPFFMQIIEVP